MSDHRDDPSKAAFGADGPELIYTAPAAPGHAHIEALRTAADRLEAGYEVVRHHLAMQLELNRRIKGAPEDEPGWEPETQIDQNGRFILLDALTAIVNARTALARIEADQ